MKTGVGGDLQIEHLRRLSIVFAVELRLKIVAELYMREMSPTQFYEEFGGGSLSRVTQNFDRLTETGWLRHVRSEGPGGRRRGATESFYRATELAYFDPETWAVLPYSIRVAFSWNSFKEIAIRLRGAIEAGTFDARRGRSLTHRSLRLDRRGWLRLIEAVREQFATLFVEQDDARSRIARSPEQPIRASIVQVAFESPLERDRASGPLLMETDEALVPLPVRMSKVFNDVVCLRIVDEANRRKISAALFYADFGGDLVGIRRRFKKLAEIGWLKQVEQKTGGRRRGATEKFYRATGPALFANDGPWASVPTSMRRSLGWTGFEQLSALIKDAMKAGTFDARTDSCLAWSLLELDQPGWERVVEELDSLRAFAEEEEARAAARLEASGEQPVLMTLALGAFESPKGPERES